MPSKLRRLSPSGWAVLLIAVGSLLTVPFARQGFFQAGARSQPAEDRFTVDQPQQRMVNEPRSISDRPRVPDRPDGLSPRAGSTSCQDPSAEGQAPHGTEVEFPEWARRPSPLDALMRQQPAGVQGNEIDRVPSWNPWQPPELENGEQLVETGVTQANSDRFTPFSDADSLRTPASPLALSSIQWPDQKLRIQQEASTDRDLRGTILQELPAPSRAVAARVDRESDSDPATGGSWGATFYSVLSASPIRGSAAELTTESRKAKYGAALRSRIPPAVELFIVQPGSQ